MDLIESSLKGPIYPVASNYSRPREVTEEVLEVKGLLNLQTEKMIGSEPNERVLSER